MAEYQLAKDGVVRKSDGALIPESESNSDWVEFRHWLEAGGVPDPITPVDQNAALWAQIFDLEAQKLMPRALRDIILKDASNPAYQTVKALDDQIKSLKAEMS